MAVSPTLCLTSKMNSAQPSIICASKVRKDLRAKSPYCFGVGIPNLNVKFRDKVYKSIGSNGKATRGRVTMMPIGVPRVPYRNRYGNTWQWIDLWNALYRDRIIFLGKYIDEEFSNRILPTLLYLDSVDNEKLYLYISGPGGDLSPSMGIYDTMKSLKSPIATHCVGNTYNLATFILAAGDKGDRSSLPLARIALQAPAGAARGQADDINNEALRLIRVRDYLFKELARNTGQSLEKIHKDLNVLKYFGAQEALEYGLIDKIGKHKHGRSEDKNSEDDPNKGLG